ncbi:MAG: response regulator transcription factor [Anaerolineales bacterium]|jgi:DNA-binding response OmpR family regulator
MAAKILIVDDDAGVRESLEELLRLEDYQADSTGSGEDALEALSQGFDLVLLDIKMPGIGGVEVMHEIRKYHPNTRIIIITGYGSLESAIDAIRSGAQDYMLKPYTADDILLSISKALSEKESRARKEILIEQLESSLDQLKDVEGIRTEELPARRVVNLPRGITVDLERREMWRGADRVRLTPTESKLLSIFLENRGRVMNHQEIVFLVQGFEISEWEAPEVLRPMISRLRKKLALFPGVEEWVSNVRGTGYLFDPS